MFLRLVPEEPELRWFFFPHSIIYPSAKLYTQIITWFDMFLRSCHISNQVPYKQTQNVRSHFHFLQKIDCNSAQDLFGKPFNSVGLLQRFSLPYNKNGWNYGIKETKLLVALIWTIGYLKKIFLWVCYTVLTKFWEQNKPKHLLPYLTKTILHELLSIEKKKFSITFIFEYYFVKLSPNHNKTQRLLNQKIWSSNFQYSDTFT